MPLRPVNCLMYVNRTLPTGCTTQVTRGESARASISLSRVGVVTIYSARVYKRPLLQQAGSELRSRDHFGKLSRLPVGSRDQADGGDAAPSQKGASCHDAS